jgi:hypothetical protein
MVNWKKQKKRMAEALTATFHRRLPARRHAGRMEGGVHHTPAHYHDVPLHAIDTCEGGEGKSSELAQEDEREGLT